MQTRYRDLDKDAAYHVSAIANRSEMIFDEQAMKDLFTEFLIRVKKKYALSILHYCIMGNHVHILIKPKNGNDLPKIMQWLLGNYAKAWNRAHGVRGHLWKARYFSRIIRDYRGFMKVFDYVSKNPLKAHLVEKLENWKDSGIAHFLAQRRDVIDISFTGILDGIPLCLEDIYKTYCVRFSFDGL